MALFALLEFKGDGDGVGEGKICIVVVDEAALFVEAKVTYTGDEMLPYFWLARHIDLNMVTILISYHIVFYHILLIWFRLPYFIIMVIYHNIINMVIIMQILL